LENHERKECVQVDEYTIEHILPQNESLSIEWKDALGADWERVQQTWLHTLGNLTLTGYNSEYSDKPFSEKRDMKGGFKESPLRLNAELAHLTQWNEEALRVRAGRLAEMALTVWPAPKLEADILIAYKPKASRIERTAVYKIEDHPFLLAPAMRKVFEALRKEVLALDPCVTEEFLKLYVAFKAETNFVDVVPQAKRLRLSLNIPFPEINDPKGICKDVSDVGRWGNGDTEVGLASLDEVPYLMGLVRQSFQRQMGDGSDA
jgi:predicted transport protein